jgi:hypothetical protein
MIQWLLDIHVTNDVRFRSLYKRRNFSTKFMVLVPFKLIRAGLGDFLAGILRHVLLLDETS